MKYYLDEITKVPFLKIRNPFKWPLNNMFYFLETSYWDALTYCSYRASYFPGCKAMPPKDSHTNENKNLTNRQKSEVWYSIRNPGLGAKRPQLQIWVSQTCCKFSRNL